MYIYSKNNEWKYTSKPNIKNPKWFCQSEATAILNWQRRKTVWKDSETKGNRHFIRIFFDSIEYRLSMCLYCDCGCGLPTLVVLFNVLNQQTYYALFLRLLLPLWTMQIASFFIHFFFLTTSYLLKALRIFFLSL